MAVNIGPKIGIDGEAQYRKELSNLIQATKTYKAQMEALTSSFDKNGSRLKQNKEKYKALKSAQEAAKKEVDRLADAVDKSERQTGEASTQTLKWKEALAKAKTELNNLNSELADSHPIKGFSEDMAKASDALKSAGSRMQDIGGKMTAAVTVPVVGAGTAAVKTAADFETSMNKVEAVTGATTDQMDQLEQKAKNIGITTKYSASEAGDAMTYMGMAGWKTGDILDGVDGIINLAAASGADLATTSDILTDGLTAFGLKAKDSGRMANVMAAASANANTNVELLGESYKYAAATAGAMGYSVEDITESLGLMANAGVKGSQAGTSLRTSMVNLAKPTKQMAEAMDKYGISITKEDGSMKSWNEVVDGLRKSLGGLPEAEQTAAAAAIFGKDAVAGMLSVINAAPSDINKLNTAIKDSDGVAEQMKNTMEQGLNGQITKLKSSIEGLSISFGEKLAPTVENIIGGIQKLTDKLNSMSGEQIEGIIKFLGAIAVAGPAISIIGGITSGLGGLFGAISAVSGAIGTFSGLMSAGSSVGAALIGTFGGINLAILAVVAVIGAVIAIGVLLYKNWDKIKEKAKEIKEGVVNEFGRMKSDFSRNFNEMKNIASEKFNSIKEKVSGAMSKIKGILSGELKFPHIKTPHFRISGGEMPWGLGGVGTKPSIAIDWYGKAYGQAYALDGAQVFGAMNGRALAGGEGHGRELVLGENYFANSLVSAFKSAFGYVPGSGGNTFGDTNITVYGAPGQDVRELADIIERRISDNVRRRSMAW